MTQLFRLIWRDRTLRLVMTVVLIFGAMVSSLGIFQSLIAVTVFGLSDGEYAVVLFLALLVTVGASVGVGIITDQRPSRRLMTMTAIVSMIAGAGLVLIGQSTAAFVAAHVIFLPLYGTIFNQVFAVSRLTTSNLPRAERDGILAIVRAGFAVPFVILLPLWGWAFDAGLPLISVYVFIVLCGFLLMWVVVVQWPRDTATPWAEQPSGLGFRASLSEMLVPYVLIRVMLVGAIHCGTVLAGVLLGLVFNEASGRGPGDVGLFFASFVLLEIGVTLMIGQIRRLMRRLYIIAIGVFSYAVFLVLLPLLADRAAVWFLIIPVGIGGALIYALAIGYLQDLLGTRAGAGSSLLALQRLSSDGLSALVFALGSALAGYWLAAVLGAVVMVAAMVAILWLDRRATAES